MNALTLALEQALRTIISRPIRYLLRNRNRRRRLLVKWIRLRRGIIPLMLKVLRGCIHSIRFIWTVIVHICRAALLPQERRENREDLVVFDDIKGEYREYSLPVSELAAELPAHSRHIYDAKNVWALGGGTGAAGLWLAGMLVLNLGVGWPLPVAVIYSLLLLPVGGGIGIIFVSRRMGSRPKWLVRLTYPFKCENCEDDRPFQFIEQTSLSYSADAQRRPTTSKPDIVQYHLMQLCMGCNKAQTADVASINRQKSILVGIDPIKHQSPDDPNASFVFDLLQMRHLRRFLTDRNTNNREKIMLGMLIGLVAVLLIALFYFLNVFGG